MSIKATYWGRVGVVEDNQDYVGDLGSKVQNIRSTCTKIESEFECVREYATRHSRDS